MLEHLIGSKTRLKLLQLFFRSSGRSFYVREMARQLETQLNAVRREIANLEKLGIIRQVDASTAKIEEIGTERSKYYKLNTDFLLYPELQALLIKSQELEEQKLIEDIKRKGGKIKFLLLTGNFTSEPAALTDLLIVGQVKVVFIAKVIRDFEKLVGRPIRYTVMEEEEFRDRREIGDRFLYSVFESKNIVALDELGIS